jgi:hypothetical protein
MLNNIKGAINQQCRKKVRGSPIELKDKKG